MLIRAAVATLALWIASAADATSEGLHIPEPGDAALFVIAVAALVIGRQASKHPPREK